MLKNYCTLYIVRHGETDWNVERRLQGHSGLGLNEKGREQAKGSARFFKNFDFDAIYSSDLARALDTAQIIAAERELEIKLSKLLRERKFGPTEGLNRQEIDARNDLKEAVDKHLALPPKKRWHKKAFEDQESEHEAVTRVLIKLRAIAASHLGKNILVVSHGGVMIRLLVSLGYFSFDNFEEMRFKNTGYFKLHSDGVDFFVVEVVGLEKREIK